MKALIEALYNPNVVLPREPEVYRDILDSTDFPFVGSQIYVLLKNQGRLENTPSFFQNNLRNQFRETSFLNLFIKKETERLLGTFEKQGLDVIPIKGVSFSEDAFGHFGARRTSDIDLLIKKEAIESAVKAVQSHGFEMEEDQVQDHFHFSLSKPLPGSAIPLTVELHWDLLKEDTADLNITKYWDEAIDVAPFRHVKRLSPFYTFYMITLHGWRHNLDSWKYYLDMIQLLTSSRAKDWDFDRLLREARADRTEKRVIRTLSRVYGEFSWLHQHFAFPYEKKREGLKLGASRRGRIGAYLDFMDYQFLSYDRISHSFKELGHWLWPSVSDVKRELGGMGTTQNRELYFHLYKRRLGSLWRRVKKSRKYS